MLCWRLREFNSVDVTDCASWPQCQRMIPGTVWFISTDLAFISWYFPYPSHVKLVQIPPSHHSLCLYVTVMCLIIPHQQILWTWQSIGVTHAFYLNPWIFDKSIFHFPLCSYLIFFPLSIRQYLLHFSFLPFQSKQCFSQSFYILYKVRK